MYKLLENLPGLAPKAVQRLSDETCIPFDIDNMDYQKFLKDINKNGASIVDNDLPESVLADAQTILDDTSNDIN
jgi:hypothetical protein